MLKKSVVAIMAALVAACMAGPAAADIVCPDIRSALDLLGNPKRLIATLRS